MPHHRDWPWPCSCRGRALLAIAIHRLAHAQGYRGGDRRQLHAQRADLCVRPFNAALVVSRLIMSFVRVF